MIPKDLNAPLAIQVHQIVEGEQTCDFCDKAAAALLATGADPKLVPVCSEHVVWFFHLTAAQFSGFVHVRAG